MLALKKGGKWRVESKIIYTDHYHQHRLSEIVFAAVISNIWLRFRKPPVFEKAMWCYGIRQHNYCRKLSILGDSACCWSCQKGRYYVPVNRLDVERNGSLSLASTYHKRQWRIHDIERMAKPCIDIAGVIKYHLKKAENVKRWRIFFWIVEK